MTLRRRLINRWLRSVEKPRMTRADHPAPLRRALEFQARILFHPPRGTSQRWINRNGIDLLEITPARLTSETHLLFYIHGGGFTFGSPKTHAAMVAQLAQRLGVRAVLPRYRLAPEHPYPAAPDDVRAAWQGVTAEDTDAGMIILGGDSAGGALAFGLLSSLCGEKAPLPAAVFGFSPLTDLTYSGDSFRENASAEVLLPAERAADMAQMFLNGQSPDDPRVSPLVGGFDGASAIWVTAGDTEILRDDARRLVQRCLDQGVKATLEERHDLPHVWPIFHNTLPEARETLDSLAAWVRQQPGWQGES